VYDSEERVCVCWCDVRAEYFVDLCSIQFLFPERQTLAVFVVVGQLAVVENGTKLENGSDRGLG
jgi:hypothetical protein